MQLQHRAFRNVQTGLSLIELMIAVLVGVVLIAGVLSIFISSRKSYGINSAVARLQDNGRFALNFIQHDTRLAGFMGCATSATTTSYLNPNPTGTNLAYSFGTAIQGYEYNGTAPTFTYTIAAENPSPAPAASAGNWTPALDGAVAGSVIPGTDVLVVRYTESGTNPSYVTTAPAPPVATFNVSNTTGLAARDLVIISDCTSASIFQIDAPVAGDVISHGLAAVNPGNAVANPPNGFQLNSQISIPTTAVFYVGLGADGSPALFRALTSTATASGFTSTELVSGVENMQILYGVDTTLSQTPSEYDTAGVVTAAGTWPNVVSVRIALLLRSDTGAVTLPAAATTSNLLGTTITAPLDTRLRQVFVTTIGLRNSLP
ncbi:MAG: PilW family protein [Gammaproteobacteria bacterium]